MVEVENASVNLVIEPLTLRVEVDGQVLNCSDQEAAVLAALASNRVTSRREIIAAAGLEGRSQRRCEGVIASLRKQLGDGSIENQRRRGWRLTLSTSITGSHFDEGSTLGRE